MIGPRFQSPRARLLDRSSRARRCWRTGVGCWAIGCWGIVFGCVSTVYSQSPGYAVVASLPDTQAAGVERIPPPWIALRDDGPNLSPPPEPQPMFPPVIVDEPLPPLRSPDDPIAPTYAEPSPPVDLDANLLAPPAQPPSAEPATGAEGIVVEEMDVMRLPDLLHTWCCESTWFRFTAPQRFEVGGNMTSGTRNGWTTLTKSIWSEDNKWIKSRSEISGRMVTVEEERSSNEWIALTTTDVKSQTSPWLLFSKMSAEYDEIEQLSLRSTLSGGIGYRIGKLGEANRFIIVRVGPTATYERYFRPRREEWTPQMLAEIEAKHAFERLTLEHRSSVYPSFDGEEGIRLQNESGLLIPLDDKRFWSCRFGYRHTYNDNHNADVQPNDFELSFTVVFQKPTAPAGPPLMALPPRVSPW